MQRHPVTIEEQLILKAIKEECVWENLPKRLHVIFSSKEEWHRRIVHYCVKKRLQWNTCFARKACKEGEYYEDMMHYLRKNMALFPYHLAEYVCRVMRVSPFRYYCDMMFEVMKNEQPYDSIPNFSAADALRVTGIGRNEFIDIMNKCRSKKIMWKLNKSIAKDLLPTQPVDFTIESWWGVCLVNFTLEEFKKLSEEEMATIDKVCKEEVNAYILFDPDIIKGLYRRGLIYFDVPVYTDDRFKVSRLEGFVSNREQSYEDPIEELLYAVFVVSSENATVADLASTLQADLPQLQAAASFACRLGWAQKVIDPGSILRDSSTPASIDTPLSIEDGSLPGLKSVTDGIRGQEDVFGMEHLRREDGSFHVAFVVDANITSYLMMGSVSPGLKSHAVTLYEAGKLGDESIADLCRDLCTLAGTKFEGELQEFANHASSLRCILECLRSGGISADANSTEIWGERTEQPSSTSDVCSLSDKVSLPQSTEIMGTGKHDLHDHDYFQAGSLSEGVRLHSFGENFSTGLEDKISSDVNSNIDFYDDPVTGKIQDKEIPSLTTKKFFVDILRCESLAALAPATLERLFRRDYDIVVSMIPLPYSCTLPGPSGPTHFGPPSHAFMTPWMRLLLYSDVRSGPLSVVLMKGQCLRLLPTPLAGCEKALLWSWDGSAVGGLGGKFEGNLVKGGFLLHCLNSLLKHSAVLVQPLSRYDLDASGNIIFIDIPLPLKNSDGSIVHIGQELGLAAEEYRSLDLTLSNVASNIDLSTIGYIRFLRIFKEGELTKFSAEYEQYEWVPLSIQFGIPLFSPELCSNICKRVVCSQLLQADSVAQHHGAMQAIRKRLHDVCAEYQATGHAGKLIYHREQSKDASRHLMNYASGKWNPLSDPSSPICGPLSEHQRLKLVTRHRCKTEVLSFDGSILRSYALAPVCEAATSPIDDPLPINASKVEADDVDSKEVILPAVNLIFDGSELHLFDITACLQARQPVALITEASNASASSFYK